ncbi:MAG: V-type ATP synthase subunit B [Dehalococcoidia bacterium]|jgi:V/A-type H+-transporting ATPase subunit B|nr:V-type ATP synthase subunit B [Dehalococcoidia bacterium]
MELSGLYVREGRAINKAKGALLIADAIPGTQYNEIVDVVLSNGEVKSGQAIDISEEATVVQVFGGVSEVDLKGSTIRCKGETLKLPVSMDMLGRIFNGMGKPLDGGPALIADEYLDINGEAINPASRQPPAEFIETGISAIDGLNVLVRGQKLPIFSGSGLPHNRIAAQIIRQAAVKGTDEKFAIVFGAIGISFDDASFFINNLERTGALERAVAFINTASDPAIERISTPRLALTAAEYLAWKQDMHVLVILTDMTNYCEALRELSSMREEIPSRRGYPGYMYTDLATIYERAGRIIGREGSVTIMPILTMPDDDITHPIPDLTGYITEGQIVLSRNLERKGVYPPIDVFLSLSRMMKEGIGPGKTRDDHNNVFMQLYASYAEGVYLREISTIIGADALGDRDRLYLSNAEGVERKFIAQGEQEKRKVEDTLGIGWNLFSALPEEDLKLIKEDFIKKYHPKYVEGAAGSAK